MIYMGLKSIFNSNEINFDKEIFKGGAISFFQGFSISILNPKIFIWFIAIYSQFMSIDNELIFNMYLILIAGIIDASWYIILSLAVTTSSALNFFQKQINFMQKIQGFFFIALGLGLLINLYFSTNWRFLNYA